LRVCGGMAARALEFAIFCAARTGEVIGARWNEIDLEERIWTVPAERMKAHRQHRVPLCEAAVAVLEKVRPLALLCDGTVAREALVFPGTRQALPLSNMAMAMTLRRLGRVGVTPHGFRSSFRDWAAERSNFPREVIEAALAHVVANKTESAYLRSDLFARRRRLMAAWDRFCTARPTGAVIPLRAAR
jgi:integrase